MAQNTESQSKKNWKTSEPIKGKDFLKARLIGDKGATIRCFEEKLRHTTRFR